MLTSGKTQEANVGGVISRNEHREMSGNSHNDPLTSVVGLGSRTSDLQDSKIDVKIVLSALWISMMFVFAYVDIFGYWRADVINGALDGKVPGSGFKINQAFLNIITLYIIIPSLMVVFSLVAPARINRPVNIVASLVYAVSVAASMAGESWTYYLLGSVVEVILLLNLARVAWTWPKLSTPQRSDFGV
jgi:Family of unknown function (DUF6326)